MTPGRSKKASLTRPDKEKEAQVCLVSDYDARDVDKNLESFKLSPAD